MLSRKLISSSRLLGIYNQRLHNICNHLVNSNCKMSTSGQRYAAANDEAILEVQRNVGLISLNRPKALNALNMNMIDTIYPVMLEWEKDPNIQAIIMKGTGEKAFCAGGDVVRFCGDRSFSKEFFPKEYRLDNLIGKMIQRGVIAKVSSP